MENLYPFIRESQTLIEQMHHYLLGNGLPSMSFRFAYVDFPLKQDEQVPLLTNPKFMD